MGYTVHHKHYTYLADKPLDAPKIHERVEGGVDSLFEKIDDAANVLAITKNKQKIHKNKQE